VSRGVKSRTRVQDRVMILGRSPSAILTKMTVPGFKKCLTQGKTFHGEPRLTGVIPDPPDDPAPGLMGRQTPCGCQAAHADNLFYTVPLTV
jgi:hypothetical protein